MDNTLSLDSLFINEDMVKRGRKPRASTSSNHSPSSLDSIFIDEADVVHESKAYQETYDENGFINNTADLINQNIQQTQTLEQKIYNPDQYHKQDSNPLIKYKIFESFEHEHQYHITCEDWKSWKNTHFNDQIQKQKMRDLIQKKLANLKTHYITIEANLSFIKQNRNKLTWAYISMNQDLDSYVIDEDITTLEHIRK